MKKNFTNICLSAVIGLFFSFSDSFAQSPAKSAAYRVKLRGGVKLKGEIQNLQPTGTFTIQTTDGSTATYPASDIRCLKPLKKRKYTSADQKWHYRSIMEIGGGSSESYRIPGTDEVYDDTGELLLYTSHGLQYKHLFFAGLGAGFNLEGVEAANVPVFAHLRLVPLRTAVSPVFISNIGYHFNINDSSHGFYLSPGGGVKFRLSERADIHLIVATRSLHQTAGFYRTIYQPGPTPTSNPTYTTSYNEYEVTKRFFDFRCGITF